MHPEGRENALSPGRRPFDHDQQLMASGLPVSTRCSAFGARFARLPGDRDESGFCRVLELSMRTTLANHSQPRRQHLSGVRTFTIAREPYGHVTSDYGCFERSKLPRPPHCGHPRDEAPDCQTEATRRQTTRRRPTPLGLQAPRERSNGGLPRCQRIDASLAFQHSEPTPLGIVHSRLQNLANREAAYSAARHH
jgi:hypothetical protein